VVLQDEKFLLEVVTFFANFFQKVFFLQNLYKLESQTARQRSPAERSAVVSRAEGWRHSVGGEQSTQWNAEAERFRERQNIGPDAELFIVEVAARTSNAALDLVKDQERPMPVTQLARRLQERLAAGMNATLSLQRLDNDGANAVVEVLTEIVDVIEPNETKPRYQRFVRFAIF